MHITKAAVLFAAFTLSLSFAPDDRWGMLHRCDGERLGDLGGGRNTRGQRLGSNRGTHGRKLEARSRGGEIQVCPGTSVNVTAATQSGGAVLWAVEPVKLTLGGSSADAVRSGFPHPVPGPGRFNFAVRPMQAATPASGTGREMCVFRFLVWEWWAMGRQVRPNRRVSFSDGKVSDLVVRQVQFRSRSPSLHRHTACRAG